MSDKEPEAVYKFTPQFEGAFLRNVPQRDLTQADVDAMTPEQRRDAFAAHPACATPLYTAVEGAKFEDYSRVNDPPKRPEEPAAEGEEAPESYPKWFQDKLERAHAEGALIPLPAKGETQRAYEERGAPGGTQEG